MAALWKIKYETANADGVYETANADGVKDYDTIYFSAADARSLKPKDINASRKNAATRCKARFAKKGIKIRVVDLRCVG